MKKVMTTQETTKENKTYVRPTMEIYPVYIEHALLGKSDPKNGGAELVPPPHGEDNPGGDGND